MFHVLSNWRPFTDYFSQRTGFAVLVLAWSMGSGMVVASSVFGLGEPKDPATTIEQLARGVGADDVLYSVFRLPTSTSG